MVYNNFVMQGPNEIRNNLKKWVSLNKEHDANDVLIDELCIVDKSCRVDLVHANGKLTGFEVKSEADSLSRWPHQMDAYLRIFDEVWICCHRKHALRAIAESNDVVGVIIVDEYDSMAILKPAKTNKNINGYDLTGLLWRKELDELCIKNSIKISSRELIKEVRHRVSEAVPLDIIRKFVLEVIKLRYSK